MKCSKCEYDYPARETKCPYCGEPNKLGMEWEKEEDETRKETLLTKAKVLHSMPLYVANKIMNIILLLAVVLLVVLFIVFFIFKIYTLYNILFIQFFFIVNNILKLFYLFLRVYY